MRIFKAKARDWAKAGLQDRFSTAGLGLGLVLDLFIQPRYSQIPNLIFYIAVPIGTAIAFHVITGRAYEATKSFYSGK